MYRASRQANHLEWTMTCYLRAEKWRQSSNKGLDNFLPGLEGEEMSKGKDTVTGDAITQERKCQTVPKLQDHKPDHPSQQGYALSDPQLSQSRG